MADKGLIGTNGKVVDSDRIDEFQAAFGGQVILRGASDYDTARRIWNHSVDKKPGMIARCSGTADVIAAVNFARENGVLVSVRGGGHNVGGRAVCDDGLVIDLSGMRGIHVDAKNRTARVQPGVTLGELDRENHIHGLAVPAGVVSKTGIAGLTLGGGVGWLIRKHGMTCDNVLSFEVVTADGEFVTASSEENTDLYWALRGGGGNFGVVTSFEFRVHPISTVLGGMILYSADQATDVLRFFGNFIEQAPDELTAYAGFIHTPDGDPVFAVIPCYSGDLTEGASVLAPLREFGDPMLDAIGPMPFPAMQSLLDGAFPDGNHNYWKSAFLPELSEAAIATLVEHAQKITSPMSALIVEYYGGAASRVGNTETAFAHRKAQYSIGILTQWTEAEDAQPHIDWTRGVSDALRPFASDAYLLNFLDAEGDDVIRAAFGENYPRLVEVKNKYDPSNFFRVNHNIIPTVS